MISCWFWYCKTHELLNDLSWNTHQYYTNSQAHAWLEMDDANRSTQYLLSAEKVKLLL